MGKKLNEALQQAYIEGMQMSLAEMNEEEYFVPDLLTREPINYGQSFFLFRGRVFKDMRTWEEWLLKNARLHLIQYVLSEDENSYNELWDKHKKTRAKCLTREEK